MNKPSGKQLKAKRQALWHNELVRRCLRDTDDLLEAVLAANIAFDIQSEPSEEMTFFAESATGIASESSHHFRIECSCGKVISQCRCPSKTKETTIIEKCCPKCKSTVPELLLEPAPEDIRLSDAYLAYDIENRRAQGIFNRAIETSRKMNRSARADLEKALRSGDRTELERSIFAWMKRWQIQIAELLTTTQLAAILEGAREVAKSLPIVPMYPGNSQIPATIEPKKAMELLDELKQLSVAEREARIYELPSDQQTFIRQGLMAFEQGGEGPPTSFVPTSVSGEPERIHYPIIDQAAHELATKNVMTRADFDVLENAARQKAFTIANVESLSTIEKIRDLMAENIEQGADLQTFREKVIASVDSGTFLSDWHMETVYRTGVQTAFSDGQMIVLQHPFVRSGFPYAAYEAIDDDRVRHNHLKLMELGIQGTNIYRIDDPVFQTFRPPWDFCDRCSWIPMTVRMAASKGIAEALNWLETGVEPTPAAWVSMPNFRPPAGFKRSVSGASLSLEMALTPMPLEYFKAMPVRILALTDEQKEQQLYKQLREKFDCLLEGIQ